MPPNTSPKDLANPAFGMWNFPSQQMHFPCLGPGMRNRVEAPQSKTSNRESCAATGRNLVQALLLDLDWPPRSDTNAICATTIEVRHGETMPVNVSSITTAS